MSNKTVLSNITLSLEVNSVLECHKHLVFYTILNNKQHKNFMFNINFTIVLHIETPCYNKNESQQTK